MTDLVEADGDMAGVPVTDRGTWMQVGGGRIFYPLDPRPEEVHIDDIATALSRIIRYNGHSDDWVTVAQHCVHCEQLIRYDGGTPEARYAMLMHDAAEAYIGDMIRPLKCHFPEFKKIEQRVADAITEALEVPLIEPAICKRYDNIAWAWEKRDLFRSSREWPYTPEIPRRLGTMVQWTHEESRRRFMEMYLHLACVVSWRKNPPDLVPVPIPLTDDEKRRIAEDARDETDDGLDHWENHTDTRDWRDV
jgi:hypothetical protein